MNVPDEVIAAADRLSKTVWYLTGRADVLPQAWLKEDWDLAFSELDDIRAALGVLHAQYVALHAEMKLADPR